MIDCDVHNDWATTDDLLPYMDPNFRDYLLRGELPGPHGAFPKAQRPWLHPEGFTRSDIGAASPDHPGSDYEVMREILLDRFDYDYAILLGEEPIEVSTLGNPYYAQALASAYNDYMIEHWLPRDKRFMGSLIVAPQDPHGAAAKSAGWARTLASCRCWFRADRSVPMAIPSIIRSGRPRPNTTSSSRRTSAGRGT